MRWFKRKHMRSLVRRFWGSVILLVLVVAVCVQLGREAFPMLNDYRDAIAAYASERLGVHIEIGAIEASWEGMRPRLEFRGIQMRTTDQQEILTVGKAQGELSLINSLREWQLVWRELEFEQLQMQFDQTSEGRWTLGGLSLARPRVAEGSVQDPLDVFLLTRHLTLNDSTFHFAFRTGHQADLSVPQLRLENEPDFRRLTANFAVDADEEAFSVVIEGHGNPRDEEQFAVEGYVALESFPMEKGMAVLDIPAWEAASGGVWSEGHRLDSRLWFNGNPYRKMSLKGHLRADGLPLKVPDQVQMPAGLRAALTGQWQSGEGWRLAFQQAQIFWQEFASPSANLVFSGAYKQPLRLAVDQLDLQPWLGLADQAGLLRGVVGDVVKALAPTGTLSNLHLETNGLAGKDFQLRTNMEQVAVDAYRGAPAIEMLDGYLEASSMGGRVVINSRNGFSMFYPKIYQDPMSYAAASGELRWVVKPDIQRVDVSSGRLRLSGEDGEGRGYVQLRLPYGQPKVEPEMTLLVGLRGSHTRFHSKYIPTKLPQPLYDWLQTSIRGGSINRAGFLWQGALVAQPAISPSIQLFGDISDGQLQFSPDWPSLRQVWGSLMLDNKDVRVDIQRAKLGGNQLSNVRISLQGDRTEPPLVLDIQGQANGDLSDGLRLLRNSPLAEPLHALTNWRGNGSFSAELDLVVPLSRASERGRQDVQVALHDVRLTLPEQRLILDHVEGLFDYSSERGLTADDIAFDLWGETAQLNLTSMITQGQMRAVVANIKGTAPVNRVAEWLARPELSRFVEGTAAVDAQLHIPVAGESSEPQPTSLWITSDLVGVQVALPEPYGKPVEGQRPLEIAAALGPEQHYRIAYGDHARLQFLRDDKLRSLSLSLASRFAPLHEGYLDISGRLGTVDLNVWQALLQTDTTTDAAGFSPAAASDFSLTPRFDVHLDVLQLEQFALEQLYLNGEYDQGRWRAYVTSPHLTGELEVFDDERPARVDLVALRLPAQPAPDEEEEVSPLTALAERPDAFHAGELLIDEPRIDEAERSAIAQVTGDLEQAEVVPADPVSLLKNIDLSRLPAVDFSTKSLTSANSDYGAWSFRLRPVSGGIVLRDLQGSAFGLQLAGNGADGTGAELTWLQSQKGNSTQLSGVVTSTNLRNVLQRLGQVELLESDFARFELDLLWPGAPDEANLQQIAGTVAVDIRKGRFIRGADAGNNPFLRLFGLLNFDTLARRLKLDFSDLYKEGMVFDSVAGQMRFAEGRLLVQEPLRVESPASTLQFAGILDAGSEEIDATLVATLPVTGNLAVAAAFVGGLPAALGVYAVGKLFKEQVDRASSIRYRITGAWDDPRIRVDRIFESATGRDDRDYLPAPNESDGSESPTDANLEQAHGSLGGEPAPEDRIPPRN